MQLPVSYLAHYAVPSWLGRHFLLAWHLVILVVSWYPFSGWRYTGEPVFAFYGYPLPYYYTPLDNAVNLLAYLPLGYAWALTWKCRWYAPLLSLTCGALLSGGIEFVQQFLPDRVASNLDILYNGLGALLGALAAGLFSKLLIVRRWHVLRQRWFRPGGLVDYGLVLVALWLLTQMNPAVPLFGIVVEPTGLPQPFVSPIHDARLFLRLLEASGVMLSVSAVALFAVTLLAQRRHSPGLVVGLVLAALSIKVTTAGVMLKPTEFLAWFNLNVLAGGLAAVAALTLLMRLQRRWQALLAMLCLLAAQVVEALWPLQGSFYGMADLFKWRYGHLRDFNGLSQTVSEVWPWLAMAYLGLSFAGERQAERTTVIQR
ncbi:VanZ family protein [Chitinimonas lacunae]|uniref:VanZ family protein n=1 Tax=Chitinimonas lacunae TaxID=1963018 RepID=A0ABV8MPC1_9NEIS